MTTKTMSVYFRTGPNTAASVPWWVYVFFVLPFQAIYLFCKVLVVGTVAICSFFVMATRAGYGWWQKHRNDE
jgi:hypothetical protein